MKKRHEDINVARRRLVEAMIALPALTIAAIRLPASTGLAAASVPASLMPTPACDDGDDDDPTPAQTEGPYFKSSSPRRESLIEAGTAGTLLTVTGRVLSTTCQPVVAAKLDFWQADAHGNYDNSGFRLRGHQFSGVDGRFHLQTIVPGLYPGRTRHIHVKVQAPGRPPLTTQLYFPDEPRNRRDRIFAPALLMDVGEDTSGRAARFDFVLEL